jgi:hypothetical protein
MSTEADTPDPLELELLAALGTPGQWCWRVYSRRLDRVLWIARDAASAAVLIEGDSELPVLFSDDLDEFNETSTTASLLARLDTIAARNAARDWRGGGPGT